MGNTQGQAAAAAPRGSGGETPEMVLHALMTRSGVELDALFTQMKSNFTPAPPGLIGALRKLFEDGRYYYHRSEADEPPENWFYAHLFLKLLPFSVHREIGAAESIVASFGDEIGPFEGTTAGNRLFDYVLARIKEKEIGAVVITRKDGGWYDVQLDNVLEILSSPKIEKTDGLEVARRRIRRTMKHRLVALEQSSNPRSKTLLTQLKREYGIYIDY